MKICCDVCCKEEATLFCYADEAALCQVCDLRVHHANKLATKHCRFSILHPSFNDSPLCDICQERRGFIFCQEDRAILCIKCDLAMHRANEYTQKHNRLFLTGAKLISSPSSSNIGFNESQSLLCSKRFDSVSNNEILRSGSIKKPLPSASTYRVEDDYSTNSDNASVSTSSISEYLMETLPGWPVDDFLQPTSAANAFSKIFEPLLVMKP